MDRSDFGKGISKLQMAYNQKFTSEKLDFWWNKLNKMDGDKFLKRIDELIPQKQFMPNIAEILDKKERLSNFEGRDYSNFDFNSLIKNKDFI